MLIRQADKSLKLTADLAEYYLSEAKGYVRKGTLRALRCRDKVLNQAVRRNLNRFPDDFMFQLTKDEFRFRKLTDHYPAESLLLTYYASRNRLISMIRSFRDLNAERLFNDQDKPKFRSVERVARRKLLYLHRAVNLEDLRVPPGNRLESLKGDRRGQYSVRVNDQLRICFRWKDGDAFDVEITDYH